MTRQEELYLIFLQIIDDLRKDQEFKRGEILMVMEKVYQELMDEVL